ncbi:MAG: methyltransferase type 11 [Rhodospirillales bacterium]|nr:methyltransferase type 11 [Rhodospirillales bacterium]
MASCPITGAPAALVQVVGAKLLRALWRHSFGLTPAVLPERGEFTLWRSPCGLMFFAPPIEGDAAFYEALYVKLDAPAVIRRGAPTRPEYLAAARHVRARDTVLDVGAGPGAFAELVPQAQVTALDPHAAAGGGILRETAAAHAARLGEAYDVVTAFQVIEHVADPLALTRAMLACLKPGGLLILGAPLWPSPMTAIPNFCLNAPPHHLSWWSASAMRELAVRLGLEVRELALLPASPGQMLIHWMGVLAPFKTAKTAPGSAPAGPGTRAFSPPTSRPGSSRRCAGFHQIRRLISCCWWRENQRVDRPPLSTVSSPAHARPAPPHRRLRAVAHRAVSPPPVARGGCAGAASPGQ